MLKKLTPKYKYAGVYMIKNERNGKVYIGSSSDIEMCLSKHRNLLANGKHPCKELQKDYDMKHPMTSHVLYVEPVPSNQRMTDRYRFYAIEWKFIVEYNAIEKGYNQLPISKIVQNAI